MNSVGESKALKAEMRLKSLFDTLVSLPLSSFFCLRTRRMMEVLFSSLAHFEASVIQCVNMICKLASIIQMPAIITERAVISLLSKSCRNILICKECM